MEQKTPKNGRGSLFVMRFLVLLAFSVAVTAIKSPNGTVEIEYEFGATPTTKPVMTTTPVVIAVTTPSTTPRTTPTRTPPNTPVTTARPVIPSPAVPPVIFDNGIPVIGEILEIVGDLLGTLGKTANDPEAEAIIDAEALRPVNGPPSISHSEDCKMCPQVMPECKCIRERDCIYHPQTCERCAHFTCDGPMPIWKLRKKQKAEVSSSNDTKLPISEGQEQLKVTYSVNEVDITKSILIREEMTALQIIEETVKRLHLDSRPESFSLILDTNDHPPRRLLKATECPLKLFKAMGRTDFEISLVRRHVSSSQLLSPSAYQIKLKQILQDFPHNQHCADCRRANPQFLVQNLGISVCAECAVVYAFELPENIPFLPIVRPLNFYKYASVEMLASLESRGNENSNKQFRLIPKQLELTDRKGHIVEKYFKHVNRDATVKFGEYLVSRNIGGMISAWVTGHDVNEGENETLPPLHFATLAGDEGLVRLLLCMGADSLLRNQSGHTALFYAARNGSPSMIELLAKDQIKRAASTRLRSLGSDAASQSTLRAMLRQTGSFSDWNDIDLDHQQYYRLFSDLCQEIEGRITPSLKTSATNAARDKLSQLSDVDLEDLVKVVFREQELREIIQTEKRLSSSGKFSAYLGQDWLEKLRIDQERERMGNTLSREKGFCASLDNPLDCSNSLEKVGATIKDTLKDLQESLKCLVTGDISFETRAKVYNLAKQFTEQFVQTQGYTPDLECETKLNQIGVSSKKIQTMLEDVDDIQNEVTNMLKLIRDVMHLLKNLLQ